MHRNKVKHSNRDTEAQQEIDQLKKILLTMLWRLGENTSLDVLDTPNFDPFLLYLALPLSARADLETLPLALDVVGI